MCHHIFRTSLCCGRSGLPCGKLFLERICVVTCQEEDKNATYCIGDSHSINVEPMVMGSLLGDDDLQGAAIPWGLCDMCTLLDDDSTDLDTPPEGTQSACGPVVEPSTMLHPDLVATDSREPDANKTHQEISSLKQDDQDNDQEEHERYILNAPKGMTMKYINHIPDGLMDLKAMNQIKYISDGPGGMNQKRIKHIPDGTRGMNRKQVKNWLDSVALPHKAYLCSWNNNESPPVRQSEIYYQLQDDEDVVNTPNLDNISEDELRDFPQLTPVPVGASARQAPILPDYFKDYVLGPMEPAVPKRQPHLYYPTLADIDGSVC